MMKMKSLVFVLVGRISNLVFRHFNWVKSVSLPQQSQTLFLGEFNDSFAFTSTGQKMSKSNDQILEESYGESFGPSDVIASYIEFDENLIRISFAKNGEDYGQAFELTKNDSNEFYPHILVKNVKFECNFGQLVRNHVFTLGMISN